MLLLDNLDMLVSGDMFGRQLAYRLMHDTPPVGVSVVATALTADSLSQLFADYSYFDRECKLAPTAEHL